MRITLTSVSCFGFAALLALAVVSAQASPIGTITVCYACQNTGDPLIDAALAANTGVASDGILFAFKNTSSFAITGGLFSLSGTSPADSFVVPTIAAGGEFIFMPGITSDGGSHPSGGLLAATGVMDTSDGSGGVTDSTIFKFTGISNTLAVSSITAGSSTGIAGTFTAGDPGLAKPWISPGGGSTSFLGLGPNGDGGCTNCFFSVVATLNTPTVGSVPEPQSFVLVLTGLGMVGWIVRRRTTRQRP
jgi:hypothetical protein